MARWRCLLLYACFRGFGSQLRPFGVVSTTESPIDVLTKLGVEKDEKVVLVVSSIYSVPRITDSLISIASGKYITYLVLMVISKTRTSAAVVAQLPLGRRRSRQSTKISFC